MCKVRQTHMICGHSTDCYTPHHMWQYCKNGHCYKIVQNVSIYELCRPCHDSYYGTPDGKKWREKRIRDWWEPKRRKYFDEWMEYWWNEPFNMATTRVFWANKGRECAGFAKYLEVENLDPMPGKNKLFDEWMVGEREKQYERFCNLVKKTGSLEKYDADKLRRTLYDDDEYIEKVSSAWKEVEAAAEAMYNADENLKKLPFGDIRRREATVQLLTAKDDARQAAKTYQFNFQKQIQLRIIRIAEILRKGQEPDTKIYRYLPVAYPGEYPADIGIDWGNVPRYYSGTNPEQFDPATYKRRAPDANSDLDGPDPKVRRPNWMTAHNWALNLRRARRAMEGVEEEEEDTTPFDNLRRKGKRFTPPADGGPADQRAKIDTAPPIIRKIKPLPMRSRGPRPTMCWRPAAQPQKSVIRVPRRESPLSEVEVCEVWPADTRDTYAQVLEWSKGNGLFP